MGDPAAQDQAEANAMAYYRCGRQVLATLMVTFTPDVFKILSAQAAEMAKGWSVDARQTVVRGINDGAALANTFNQGFSTEILADAARQQMDELLGPDFAPEPEDLDEDDEGE